MGPFLGVSRGDQLGRATARDALDAQRPCEMIANAYLGQHRRHQGALWPGQYSGNVPGVFAMVESKCRRLARPHGLAER